MTVDPEDVITIGNRLLDHHAGTFSDEFDRNQKVVRDLTDVQSIHLRNRIAGYITRQQQQSS
ncbi:30S ribosomal protein S17e [Salinibaculum salinum]|uniref:30S ribosomal protein S17e n=1 Tax=Salinibaculum salinum TaxID=3131996 RepID=UPI0030EB384C